MKGIEPSYSAWKAAALPLSYTRFCSLLLFSAIHRLDHAGNPTFQQTVSFGQPKNSINPNLWEV